MKQPKVTVSISYQNIIQLLVVVAGFFLARFIHQSLSPAQLAWIDRTWSIIHPYAAALAISVMLLIVVHSIMVHRIVRTDNGFRRSLRFVSPLLKFNYSYLYNRNPKT